MNLVVPYDSPRKHGPARPRKRRGLTLVIVVVVMGIAAGLLSVLVAMNVDMFRKLQTERARCAVRSISTSVAAYVDRHRDELADMTPGETVTLEVAELTGGWMESQVEIERIDREEGDVLQMTTRIQRGRIVVQAVHERAVNPAD